MTYREFRPVLFRLVTALVFVAAIGLLRNQAASADVVCHYTTHHWCVWDDWSLPCYYMEDEWCPNFCSSYGGGSQFGCGPNETLTPSDGYCACRD